jgi:uncharacterized protein (TIGR02145 family)
MRSLSKLGILGLLVLSTFLHSCKKEELPTLSTSTISNITATTASSGGNITSDGGAGVIARGACWSVNADPTTSDSKTVDGNGDGQFTSTLTGLVAGSTYHIRAYATNSVGTAYGSDLLFATLGKAPECLSQAATNITSSGATLNGTVDANYLPTTVTFEYGTSTSYGQSLTSAQSPVTGNNITNVSADISNLNPGTIYHFRVIGTNSIGTTNGNDLTFTTGSILPTLITSPVSNKTATSVKTGGTITSDGGAAITARGVCWATTPNPTILNNKTSDGTGSGAFTSSITGLTPGMSYYVRAYATNSSGTAYGDELSFTTLATVPTLTTASITDKTRTTATSGGNVLSDGGSVVTARGVCWSTTPNPTTDGSHTSSGTGTGIFSSSLTSLTPGTTYYVRAYATNSAGTGFGNEVSFTTRTIDLPVVTTAEITSIASTTAISGGDITFDGGGAITARGVCWSTTPNPIIANSKTSNGTGIGIFISNISGLIPGTYYHVRAYATNNSGTAYGDDLIFKALPVVPVLTTSPVTEIAQTTATSGGTINYDGGAEIISKGICWSLNPDPTLAEDHTNDGLGIGNYFSHLAGLRINATYYVRAYATNITGTGYGNLIIFKTIIGSIIFNPAYTYGSVVDIDENIYKTIQIGSQVWMAENLRTTRYNDASNIPYIENSSDWINLSSPGYCWYDNDPVLYKNTYGILYNGYTINTGKLCPTGWHIPTEAEWSTLIYYLGGEDGESMAGGKLKEIGTSHWTIPNTGATNALGFTALPGGEREVPDGTFRHIGRFGNWWMSNEWRTCCTYSRSLFNEGTYVSGIIADNKFGFSARCIKD